jgi:hypothetical protein
MDDRYRDHYDRNFDRFDKYDGFPAIVSSIRERRWPEKFKPIGIDKFDGKQDPVIGFAYSPPQFKLRKETTMTKSITSPSS